MSYGWCAKPVARKSAGLAATNAAGLFCGHERTSAEVPLRRFRLSSRQYSWRMKRSASIDCVMPLRLRWPCGAVSPIRTVSVPWPESARPFHAAAEQLAVDGGRGLDLALGRCAGRATTAASASRPGWARSRSTSSRRGAGRGSRRCSACPRPARRARTRPGWAPTCRCRSWRDGGRLAGRPARHGRRDVEVHEDAARQRAADQPVVALPVLRGIGHRIGRVEVRLGLLVVGRRDDRPEDRHADAVDAERVRAGPACSSTFSGDP